MKKYNKFLFSAVFFAVLLFPNQSFAISGACSSHGGVNCSAGASVYGNAICNDGFESSTSFYLADECQTTNVSYQFCAPPIKNGCSTESDYGIVSYHVAMQEVVSGWPDDLATCRSEINSYQAQLATYNACVSANATAQQQSIQNQQQSLATGLQQAEDAVCQKPHGIYSRYDSTKNACACKSGYEADPVSSQCSSCVQLHGTYSQYDQTNAKCACQRGYWLDPSNSQCELPTTVCANTLGQYSHPAANSCVCIDGFNGSSGTCVDARPIRPITQQALDWAKSNRSCQSDPSLSADELQQCFVYESNPDKFQWQVSDAQSQTPTNTTNTTPTDGMTSLGQAIASETQAVKCTNTDYPYLGYDGICHKAPNVAPGSLTAAQIAKLRAAAGLSPTVPTSTVFNKNTATTATTTGSVASSTPAPAPKQKHWYEWLNPLNWFSWLH